MALSGRVAVGGIFAPVVVTSRRLMVLLALLAACWSGAVMTGCGGLSVVGAPELPGDVPDAADAPVDDIADVPVAIDAADVTVPADVTVDVPPTDVVELDQPQDVAPGDVGDVGDAPFVSTDIGVLAMNARCDNAIELAEEATLDHQDLSQAAFRTEGCFAFVTGPALFYRVTVPSFDTVEVVVTPATEGPSFRPVIRLQPSCNTNRCIAQGVGDTTGTTTRWTNFSDLPQTVQVSVSNQLNVAQGRYRIVSSVGRRPRNGQCARALVVAPGTTARAQFFGDASDVLPMCAASTHPVGGPALYYRVTVPAGQVLTATTRPSTGSSNAPILRIVGGCDAPACLADSGRVAAAGNSVFWTNNETSSRDVIVAASAYPVTANTVRFDLGVTTFAPPTNLTCATAIPMVGATARVEASTIFGATVPRVCADMIPAGNALWYRVTVPARTFFVGRVTRTVGATDPVLRVYGACDGECLNPSVRGTLTPGETRWLNTSDAPAEVFLAVSGPSGASANFALETALVPVAANATCAAPRAVTVGSYIPSIDLAGAVDVPPLCVGLAVATPALWYRVNVPAGRTLVVQSRRLMTAAGDTAWSPTLRVQSACGDTGCVAISSAGTEDYSAAAIWRAGASDEEVVVSLGRSSEGTSGQVDLRFDLAPTFGNDRCEAAATIGPVERRELLQIGRGGPLVSQCGSITMGGTLYYRLSVPAGATLVAVAQRMGAIGWSSFMELSSGCGAAMCIDGSAPVNGTAALRWRNDGSEARDVRLAIGAVQNVADAIAALSVTVSPPRYTITTIAPACEEVTSAWTDLNIRGAGTATAIQPLPFAFRYFGSAVTHHSVSFNGFAQLWPSAAGVPSVTNLNNHLPWPGSPPSTVAPFWDDFIYNSGAQITARETTGAGRHYTISWANLPLSGANASFQAKLYADTDVIEFHYCRLDASAMDVAMGRGATVGLQDATATVGVEHSYNRMGAISTGVALRFTPVR